MKWYETSLTVQWDNAFELLKQGGSEAYLKALKRVYTLCTESVRGRCAIVLRCCSTATD